MSGLLSSYYYGVIVTQVLGGYAAIRLGGKAVIVITMATQGLCCLLIPSLTRLNFILLFIMRVLTGLAAVCVQVRLAYHLFVVVLFSTSYPTGEWY